MNVGGSHRVSSATSARLSVGIEGLLPDLLGQHREGVQDGLAAVDAHRVLQAQAVDVPHEALDTRVGAAPDQDPRPDLLRQLRERGVEDRDLVGRRRWR